MYLYIYLWKHLLLVDEWKDEYVRAFMNTASTRFSAVADTPLS